MCFDFSVPITWSDIISALLLIATSVAVIVAICGNKQSQKQFKANLEVQERTLNFSLFEKRMEILEYFAKKNFSIKDIAQRQSSSIDRTIESFHMLFSPNLVVEYEQLCKYSERMSAIEKKITKLQFAFLHSASAEKCAERSPIDVWDQLESAGVTALRENAEDKFKEMSQSLCQGLEDDYAELFFTLHEIKGQYSTQKQEFLVHMEDEIRSSVRKNETIQ